MVMVVTKAGTRRKVEAYVRIQVLGPDRVSLELHAMGMFEEYAKIILSVKLSISLLYFL